MRVGHILAQSMPHRPSQRLDCWITAPFESAGKNFAHELAREASDPRAIQLVDYYLWQETERTPAGDGLSSSLFRDDAKTLHAALISSIALPGDES